MSNFFRNFTAGATALVATLLLSPVAAADNELSAREQNYGDDIAPVVCKELDASGVNETSMFAIMTAISEAGDFSFDSAVDVINYVVYEHCPGHWGDLVRFGRSYREVI